MGWLTHAQWAVVADAYTPSLIITWLLVLIHAARMPEFPARKHLLTCVLSVTCVYAWMCVDQWLSLWPSFGLDYSTHTALALVFVMALSGFGRARLMMAVGSLLVYMVLMWHLAYHTWLDMLSTVLVIAPIYYWVGRINR